MFKKLFVTLILILVGTASFAGPKEDVAAFFTSYVTAANSYSENLPSFYAPNAKIVRVVIKKDGSRESVVTDTNVYMKQLRMNAKLAKMRNYKNFYTDRVITQVGKITGLHANVNHPLVLTSFRLILLSEKTLLESTK